MSLKPKELAQYPALRVTYFKGWSPNGQIYLEGQENTCLTASTHEERWLQTFWSETITPP